MPSKPSVKKVVADVAKNRVYITLKGFLDEGRLEEGYHELEVAFAKMKPGFAVVNDIAEFSPTTEEGAQWIQKCQMLAIQSNCKHVVRVTGSVLGKFQLRRLGGELYKKYDKEVYEVGSSEAAEKLLDGDRSGMEQV